MRPDPTFHASPRLAMEAPPENFAYTLLLSPDSSRPDALAVIDVKPGSPSFSQVVHIVTMAIAHGAGLMLVPIYLGLCRTIGMPPCCSRAAQRPSVGRARVPLGLAMI